MSKAEDLTGQVFGTLTVLRRGDNYVSPKGAVKVRWVCRCSEMKREVLVQAVALKSGATKSGRGNDLKASDLTGQVFGALKVLERGPTAKNGQACWWCACSLTGNRVLVTGSNLRNGNTKTGKGTKGGGAHAHDLTGQRFGFLTVLRRGDNKAPGKVRWWCWCDLTQKEALVSADQLRSGKTTSGAGTGHGRSKGHGGYNKTRANRGDFDAHTAQVYLMKLHTDSHTFLKVGISKRPRTRATEIRKQSGAKAVSVESTVTLPLRDCIELESVVSKAIKTKAWASFDLPKFDGHTEAFLCTDDTLKAAMNLVGSADFLTAHQQAGVTI